MIYLKLRQQGRCVNHKGVDRLFAEAGLQVRLGRCKKVTLADRQPIARPTPPTMSGRPISSSTGPPKGAC